MQQTQPRRPSLLRPILIGLVGAPFVVAGSIAWSLSNGSGRQIDRIGAPADLVVETGEWPIVDQPFVRDGNLWLAASDRVAGIRWWNIERQPERIDPTATIDFGVTVPRWAMPPDAGEGPFAPPIDGALWQVGTLAAGWPWLCVARQWSEQDLDRGWIPHQAVDDDGSSIARAVDRFRAPAPNARWIVLWPGLCANLALAALLIAGIAILIGRAKASRSGG
jgi:hypothetical protein